MCINNGTANTISTEDRVIMGISDNALPGVTIEDLTRVVISYEMTTCVRFCLSYGLLKCDFSLVQNDDFFQ